MLSILLIHYLLLQNTALKLIDELGGDKKKIVVGVPFYGQSYTLKKDKEHGLGSETDGPGLPGEYTQQPGMLAYYEICYRIKTRKWAVQRDSKLLEPFTFQGDQWVSYEDTTSLTEKVRQFFLGSHPYFLLEKRGDFYLFDTFKSVEEFVKYVIKYFITAKRYIAFPSVKWVNCYSLHIVP